MQVEVRLDTPRLVTDILYISATELARRFHRRRGRRITAQTVRNRAHAARLRARVARWKPILTPRHRGNRMRYARRHRRWTRRQWNLVMWSDESKFGLHRVDKRIKVWRMRGEEYNDNCVLPRETQNGGSVMVWAGISFNRKTPLVYIDGRLTGQRYLREIIRPHVEPYMRQLGQNAIFMDDNAPPHTAHIVKNHLRRRGIQQFTTGWPSKSPDLNPIEHLWDHMKNVVQKRIRPHHRLPDLRRMLTQEWNRLQPVVINRLVHSAHRRIEACIAANGGHTRY